MKLNKQLIEMSEFKAGSLLLSFMDSSTDIIFIKDLDSIYVAANREFQRLLGLSQSEIVGKSDYELFEKTLAEKFVLLDQELFKDQLHKPLEEWVTYPDGKRVFYDIIKTPLFNDEGLLIGIIGMGRDISERKLFEGILKEREQSLNELLEGMNQGLGIHEIILNDEQEAVDYRFLDINKNYEIITGLTKNQVVGKRVLEVLPETENYWIKTYGDVVKTGKSIKFENYSKELGKIFEVYAFRPKEGQFAVLVNDISVKKQYEQGLIEAKNTAERANQAKNQFLTNMSHEIRTPVNGIYGFTELLLSTNLTHEQKNYLNLVRQSSRALMRVIEDILDYTKLISNETPVEFTSFSLREIVEETKDLFELSIEQKDLEFSIHWKVGSVNWIRGDKNKIRQILMNLVGNAVKFTHQGFVSLNLSGINSKESGYQLVVEIEDSGIGISEEIQVTMFNMFEQGDDSVKKQYSGIGLGLAIVSELCKKLEGEIQVSSILGEGSKFTVKIPVSVVSTVDKTLNELTDFNIKGAQILVVEDDEVSRLFIEMLLINFGYQVQVAESGKKAIEIIEKKPIDLVLMDLQMPDLDGFETTKMIRGMGLVQDKQIPIIAITGYPTENNRDLSIAVGMNDFLSKPISKDDLLPVMERWINE